MVHIVFCVLYSTPYSTGKIGIENSQILISLHFSVSLEQACKTTFLLLKVIYVIL